MLADLTLSSFKDSVSEEDQDVIEEMMERIEDNTCLRFRLGHSESESLGGGKRKETRKKYDSTILCTWGELSTT